VGVSGKNKIPDRVASTNREVSNMENYDIKELPPATATYSCGPSRNSILIKK
jgi:hypothetical protein